MSKLVIKVETSPPTLLVYMPTTECIPRSGFIIITTTHPTPTCAAMTHVPLTNSYTTSPKIDKPVTTVTSGRKVTSSMISASTVANVGDTTTEMCPRDKYSSHIFTLLLRIHQQCWFLTDGQCAIGSNHHPYAPYDSRVHPSTHNHHHTHSSPTSAEPPPPPSAVTAAGQSPSPTSAATFTGDTTLNPTTDLPTDSLLTEITTTPLIPSSGAPTDAWLSGVSSISPPMSTSVLTSLISRILSSTSAPSTQSVTPGMIHTTPLSTLTTTALPATDATSTVVSHANSPSFPSTAVGDFTSDITSPTATTHALMPDPSVTPTWTSWPTSETAGSAATHLVTTAPLASSPSSPSLTTASDTYSTRRAPTAATSSHPDSPGAMETLLSTTLSSSGAGPSTVAATALYFSSTGTSGSSATAVTTSTPADSSMSTTHTTRTPSSLFVNNTEGTTPMSTPHTTTPRVAATSTNTGNTQTRSLAVTVPATTTPPTSVADVSSGNTESTPSAPSIPQTLHMTAESTPTPTSTTSTETPLTTATLIPTTDLPTESLSTETTATSQITSTVTPSDPLTFGTASIYPPVSTQVLASPTTTAFSSVSISSSQPITTDVTHTAPLSHLGDHIPNYQSLVYRYLSGCPLRFFHQCRDIVAIRELLSFLHHRHTGPCHVCRFHLAFITHLRSSQDFYHTLSHHGCPDPISHHSQLHSLQHLLHR
ncbi:mucin-3A-like [Peromyscus californicus insignis]|uniref:mucin-3A-like n=1 Tax=Peromyscus californicus insignis TaxID=564181 RepID=UPI0022A671CB|nr:mucin-3A-like [Peromyscus californicus insignis]